MSQVNLLNLNSVCLSPRVRVCVSVRVCQSNATGHKFNLANKHVGIHTNTHAGCERESEAAGDVSTVLQKPIAAMCRIVWQGNFSC